MTARACAFSFQVDVYLLHRKTSTDRVLINTRTHIYRVCVLDCKYRFDFFKQLIIIDRFVCDDGRVHKSDRVVSFINIGYYISHGGCVECHLVLNHVHHVG